MLNIDSSGEWPTGFSVTPYEEPVSELWLSKFQSIPSAIVSDCLGRNVGTIGLKPFHGFMPMCGTALTVRTRPGDNLLILKALQLARPGDVIVVDGGGDLSRAVVGGLMRAMALKAGVAGFVVNGAIRDCDEWSSGALPGFALGSVSRGPSCEGPGEINVPVACAGLVVNPGDLVIGDGDGVVAVPVAELPTLYERCVELQRSEESIRQEIASGQMGADKFDVILRQKGCPL